MAFHLFQKIQHDLAKPQNHWKKWGNAEAPEKALENTWKNSRNQKKPLRLKETSGFLDRQVLG